MGNKYLPAIFTSLTIIAFCALVLRSSTQSSVLAANADHIVISEVQIGQTGSASNDFIELYNPSDVPVDLDGYRLVKRTASDTTDDPIKSWTSETIIAAHGYYLWANSGWTPPVNPDSSTTATIAANNGISLRFGSADTGEIIDSVGWGIADNEFIETQALENPLADKSIERIACEGSTADSMIGADLVNGNAWDTNNNLEDFVTKEIPDPQNSNSEIENPGCALPSLTPSPTPTLSPSPSPLETYSPTPRSTHWPRHFDNVNFSCKVELITITFGRFTVKIPKLLCESK